MFVMHPQPPCGRRTFSVVLLVYVTRAKEDAQFVLCLRFALTYNHFYSPLYCLGLLVFLPFPVTR